VQQLEPGRVHAGRPRLEVPEVAEQEVQPGRPGGLRTPLSLLGARLLGHAREPSSTASRRAGPRRTAARRAPRRAAARAAPRRPTPRARRSHRPGDTRRPAAHARSWSHTADDAAPVAAQTRGEHRRADEETSADVGDCHTMGHRARDSARLTEAWQRRCCSRAARVVAHARWCSGGNQGRGAG
jgi:hypothetical protein